MDRDRVGGTLMLAGGLLGLAGTVMTIFPFSVLGVISFGLILPFGGLVYRKRPEARLLAVATLWFAPLGGIASVIVFEAGRSFSSGPASPSPPWVIQGAIGLVGSGLGLAGALTELFWTRN